jgi:hypothetical protein
MVDSRMALQTTGEGTLYLVMTVRRTVGQPEAEAGRDEAGLIL